MQRTKARFALLALLLPLLLSANALLRNDLLNKAASEYVEKMASELYAETGVHGYVIATNEHFPVGFNLVEYTKRYEADVSEPYVIFIFAPYARITEKTEQTGRVALVPSSADVAKMYDKADVYEDAVGIVAKPDKDNKMEDKYAIGIVQGFSTLADQIAEAHGKTLKSTIKEARQGIWVVQGLVLIGAAVVLWIFYIRPIFRRKRE
jgi:hypothetical protein